MLRDPAPKYRPIAGVNLQDRTWPNQHLTHAPIWCSVDLRDGNQALVDPMNHDRKLRLFDTLVAVGFKEIEIGFPSASATDYDFTRFLIEQDRIPQDVTIQVLTQARAPLIERTFASLKGCRRAIVHLYNSTSPVQRRDVFGLSKDEITQIACDGARLFQQCAANMPDVDWIFQYSPESFTATETDYAVDICQAVVSLWKQSTNNKVILNLPATVELSMPNVYADQIEYFCRQLEDRDLCTISVHPHNDRGSGIAAAELALLAGAERVEGTLFGNGERTGNVDIVTLALNLYTQGVSPDLVFDDINAIRDVYEYATQLPIHPRHPYVGDLVYTAFSGSHQDAIKKGLNAMRRRNEPFWDVPYLPIDPDDLGRNYEALIRINSQSGKGGVSYILEAEYGLILPRGLQIEFSHVVQKISDETQREITSAELWKIFVSTYFIDGQEEKPQSAPRIQFLSHQRQTPVNATPTERSALRNLTAQVVIAHKTQTISGQGNGPVAAYVQALCQALAVSLKVNAYTQHALSGGSDARAACYVELIDDQGNANHGVGLDSDITTASLLAITSACNRYLALRHAEI